MAKKATGKTKAKLSDRMEKMIRSEYLPYQLKMALEEIMQIEVNAEYIGTAEGAAAEGYSQEEAASIVEKQAKRKSQLQVRVEIVKRLIDKQKK